MKIGIGLPAAVPGASAPALGDWAERSERAGFASLSVLDRLVYDSLDPLVALAAAAARTERVELLTTVLNVPYRQNAVLLAKQLASVDQLSGGRLTPGLALGGWPEDAEISGVPLEGRGALVDGMLATMRQVWNGEVSGAGGPMPAPRPDGRLDLLFGGLTTASYRRVARSGLGWIAPFFGMGTLTDGIAGTRKAWADAGREGQPRIVVERYFSLGPDGGQVADEYLAHYYGREWFHEARVETLTGAGEIARELDRLRDAGCDDVIFFPCSADVAQVDLLASALHHLDVRDTVATA
jgi:alkanesulfonate monooxygenase SsuD/methylene tetrahydromethanopterin reductase-like flavin-dependent oxidoreductase (luciferase family)